MSDQFLVGGDHPSTLASGRPVAPGDTLPASAVDPASDVDKQLLADGLLIDLNAARKGAPHSKETST